MFKSYGNSAKWVDFVSWRSSIGKNHPLQPAQQACFILSNGFHIVGPKMKATVLGELTSPVTIHIINIIGQ